jgi:lipoyl-dependent peroxiredoxin
MVSALLTAEGAWAERGSDMQEGGGHASAIRGTATAIGGRSGSVRSSANVLDLHLDLEELGGPAVVRSRLRGLFRERAFCGLRENARRRCGNPVAAHVTIGRNEKGFFELAVKLEISVPDRDQGEIEEFVRIAHEQVCPYSLATRGNRSEGRLISRSGRDEARSSCICAPRPPGGAPNSNTPPPKLLPTH